jgi:ATP-dependent helicase Lhr and Lhr-like helicase
VNTLGWASLRPLQAEAIEPILDDEHALLLAPTAGGKTEAAVLPIFTRIVTERWRPLSTLYLCPLRALLNNLLPRLESYAGYVGAGVGLWHGDVGPAERQRLVVDLPDLLLTTPESLEAMFLSTRVDAHRLLGTVRSVIVDEVHSFASDDRGWHLLSLLERIRHLTGNELQRIGLSATVGNPGQLLEWLTPRCERAKRVVSPVTESPVDPEITIDYVGSTANAATVIAGLHRGEKRLVFVDSRMRAEEITHALRSNDVTAFVTHASLGRDERRRAEQAFTEGTDCVIVATSALELGIDVGDLDRVIHIDAPASVSSFLQRLGRAGRRTGTTRNMLFLTTSEESLWNAAGVTRLWRTGFVEPVTGPPLPAHLLAHQLLALVLQEGAVGQNTWQEWLGDPLVLGDDVAVLGDAVLEHLVGQGFLQVDGGMLSIGREAETTFGRRHFIELTSVFTSPPIFTVLAGRREIGQVHDLGIWAAYQIRNGPPVLLLAGLGWRILEVDWRRRRVHVELVESKGRTSYRGAGAPMRYELAQSVGAVLGGADPGVGLSRRAADQLDQSRLGFTPLRPGEATLIRHHPDGRTDWWTFGGLRANLELAARLGSLCRSAGQKDNLSIGLVDDAKATRVRAALDRLTPVDRLLDLGEEATGGLKFADCIPGWLADSILLARLSDRQAVLEVTDRQIDSAR